MKKNNKKVVVLALGYVGLPTAAILARTGFDVKGVDINKDIVKTINNGKIHIVEPSLDTLVSKMVKSKKLRASSKPGKGDVFIIAVPTPFKKKFRPDISYVEKAIQMIIPHLSAGNLVIIESTSPVGTTQKMTRLIYKLRPKLKDNIFVAYCPERVLPGKTLHELEHNKRVIGGINRESAKKAEEFYKSFVKGKLFLTNDKTAEMCKLVENSYRDTNIAFANELSLICHKAGIDVWELISLANQHPRVNIHYPGAGVGGHCIAVDPWFIVSDFPEESKIIRSAREINNYKTEWVLKQIEDKIKIFKKTHKRSPVIACCGLSYKPNIDDLRESPGLYITKKLVERKHTVIVAEPYRKEYKGLSIVPLTHAVSSADFIIFLVGHEEFRTVPIPPEKIVLDYCGIRT
jgi:UDP-N-acetyl-D-mannosaminuronic acid dehydrogenase